jgi:hypothetical protein
VGVKNSLGTSGSRAVVRSLVSMSLGSQSHVPDKVRCMWQRSTRKPEATVLKQRDACGLPVHNHQREMSDGESFYVKLGKYLANHPGLGDWLKWNAGPSISILNNITSKDCHYFCELGPVYWEQDPR